MAQVVDSFSAEHPSLEYVRHRGPYQVRSGNIDATGIPGIIFTPETAPRAPIVILGHGYLQPVARYEYLLRHLASWGFIAVAPATEQGLLPSYAGLARDMTDCVRLLHDAKLARGRVTVDADRVSFIGHGTGGGAAVLAAAQHRAQAVVTIAAATVRPSAVEAARQVGAPGLHIVAQRDRISRAAAGGRALALAWGNDDVQVRQLKKASHLAIAAGKHWTSKFLGEKSSKKAQQAVLTTVTAFLLRYGAGHQQLAPEITAKIPRSKLLPIPAVS